MDRHELIDDDPILLLFSAVKRLAIYIRDTNRLSISASSQEVDLRRLGAELGYQSVRVLRDAPPRHPRARESRKGLAAIMRAVRAGAVDIVAIWSIPAIGGSPRAVGEFLTGLQEAGMGLVIHHADPQQALVAGQALLAAGSHLLDLGRAERRRKTLAGQADALAHGQHIGRPRVPDAKIEKVRQALAGGAGIRAAARIAGVSPASALRIARAAAAAAAVR